MRRRPATARPRKAEPRNSNSPVAETKRAAPSAALSVSRGSGLLAGLLGARLDLDGRRGHAVLDRDLGADFQIACDLRVRVPGDLPAVLALLDRDHRVVDLENG